MSSLSATTEPGIIEKSDSDRTTKGLTVLTAAILIAGEMAGSGVLALPRAVADTGWIGILLIAVCCFNSGYTGTRLGLCWTIVEERYPKYRISSRAPYPIIGRKAFGKYMGILVSVCIAFTLIGTATVVLLLTAQMLHSLFINNSFSICYWILIIGGFLTPFCWLGSPKDFWYLALGGLIATALACIFTFVQTILDKEHNITPDPVNFKTPTLASFALGFGTIIFSFGGASTFPTIQNDMKNRQFFPRSVVYAFIMLLIMYLPVAVSGFFIFGSSVSDNIVKSVTGGFFQTATIILLCLHMFFAFVVIINPFSQQLEEILHIPTKLHWKRCVFRTFVVGLVIFIGESIPNFGSIMALIGGSTITLLTFVFPPLFYMRLCHQKNPNWKTRKLTLHEQVYLVELILIGLLGGVMSTWSAVTSIINNFTVAFPCYMKPNYKCYVENCNT
nr:amino acid transporter AVT1C-like protein [Scolopendra mutilans]